jgi:hypothetical protein
MSTNRFHAKKKKYVKKSARKRLATMERKKEKSDKGPARYNPKTGSKTHSVWKQVKPHGQHYWVANSRKRKHK